MVSGLLILLVLNACGSGSDGPARSPTEREDGGGAPTITTDSPASTTSTSLAELRNPVPPPLPPDPGYADRLGSYAQYVLGDALVPPGSIEHLEWIAACVESAGFEVEIIAEDGAIEAKPGAQTTAFREAMAACEEASYEIGLVARPEPPDEKTLAAWYDAFMLTYQCMEEHGYPVSPPPSRDLYVESGGSIWHPYQELAPTLVPEVEKVCPQDLIVLFQQLADQE